MKELRCPNCGRKLAEIADEYLEVVDERNANSTHGTIKIKCPKCKEIALI